jgi:type I restriction enzyme M protein
VFKPTKTKPASISFWLRDESLEESDNVSDPALLAQEIVEDLEAGLEQIREIAADLGSEAIQKGNKIGE